MGLYGDNNGKNSKIRSKWKAHIWRHPMRIPLSISFEGEYCGSCLFHEDWPEGIPSCRLFNNTRLAKNMNGTKRCRECHDLEINENMYKESEDMSAP